MTNTPISFTDFITVGRSLLGDAGQCGRHLPSERRYNAYVDVDIALQDHAEPASESEYMDMMERLCLRAADSRLYYSIWLDYMMAYRHSAPPGWKEPRYKEKLDNVEIAALAADAEDVR